jgi:hypothetical protein
VTVLLLIDEVFMLAELCDDRERPDDLRHIVIPAGKGFSVVVKCRRFDESPGQSTGKCSYET